MRDKVKEESPGRVTFICPGCRLPHTIRYGHTGSDWTWNGSLKSPTFMPSVLMRRTMGNFLPANDPNFKTHEEVCHSFVTCGRIQFLTDSTHELSGQTVDLLDWSDDLV